MKRALVCNIKLRQEGTVFPCSTSAGNWAHWATQMSHPSARVHDDRKSTVSIHLGGGRLKILPSG